MSNKEAINLEKLKAGVRYLKANQIIKRDFEIAYSLKYSRPAVSQYLSGKKSLSDAFVLKFEKFYKIDLSSLLAKEKKMNRGSMAEPDLKQIHTRIIRIEKLLEKLLEESGISRKKISGKR